MRQTIAGLGPVMQIAYVTRGIAQAARFWTETMGVGPFFHLPHIAYDRFRYRGAEARIDFSAAIAYWGDTQIELIEQHDDTPSIYKSWLDAGRDGVHHVCITVPDIARAREVCLGAGATMEQEIELPGGKAFYVDTGGGPGTMVEVYEPAPGLAEVFAMMRDAARDWDGTEPLRAFG